jgi:nicotinate-nucleotide adenylyltransferase
MPVWYLVPDGVVQYIEKRGLYREVPRRPAVDGARGSTPAASSSPGDGHSPPPTTETHFQEVPR